MQFIDKSKFSIVYPPAKHNPCDDLPCGNNALCTVLDGVVKCNCIPPYIGDPYTGCKPECLMNSDCIGHLACVNQHCRDPCPGVCAINAICEVFNHIPVCSCQTGYTGDPFQSCVQDRPGLFIILNLLNYYKFTYYI